MKVLNLICSGGFFGAENVIVNLVRQLSCRGFEVFTAGIVNVKDPHTELIDHLVSFGAKAFNIRCNGAIDWSTVRQIRQFLIDQSIDIIHCHGFKADILGLLASHRLRIIRIATNHLWNADTLPQQIYEFVDGLLLDEFDRIVAVSDRIADGMLQFCGHKGKIQVIYNGIDLELYSTGISPEIVEAARRSLGLAQDDFVIGAVGRLRKQKGFEFLLQAMADVLRQHSHVKLLLVGDGSFRKELQSLASSLAIDERVIFAGIRKDMPVIYALMNVFALSSIDEGLPMVLLEALAMRRAVVVTNVGAVSKVVTNGVNGWLVPPADPAALAEKIASLITEPELVEKFASEGQRTVQERFSADTMAERYIRLYLESGNWHG